MKVLIAPNAFKGSLSAVRATDIIASALPHGWESFRCPIADGGDGTLECLVAASGGRFHTATVTGPLPGMKTTCRWGEFGNRRAAIIEMAEAAGLRLLRNDQRSAANTTTSGVGELLLHALDAGFRTIYIGLGGSATNDGGAGCVQALGVKMLDRGGSELPPGGIHLRDLNAIDLSYLDARIKSCEIICLSDVQSVLTGRTGTTMIFGGQKGATLSELESLDDALRHYASVIQREVGTDVSEIPGGGAAGGLGAALAAFCGARIVSGIDYVLDLLGFDELLRQCDLVITAEGSIDEQTTQGKGVAGIARRAKTYRKPVHAFAGSVRADANVLADRLHIEAIHQISPPSMDDAESIRRAEELLELKVKEVLAALI